MSGLVASCRTEAAQSFEHVRVPSDGDHGSWRTFCFGDEAADEPQRQPTMPVLMAIDQVHLALLQGPPQSSSLYSNSTFKLLRPLHP